MRRMPILAAATVVALALVAAGVGFLLGELNQANADGRAARQALAQSNADLVAIVEKHNTLAADFDALVIQRNTVAAERDALTSDLAQTKADRDTLRNDVHELSEENRTLAHEKNVLTQEYDHLKGAHDQLTTTHEELTVTHRQLTTTHEQLGASHGALQMSHESLQMSHESLGASYKDLTLKHTELQQAAGTVQTLEAQAGNLRTEITQLEERRKPLILARERTSGFRCTGSMEPKLTCLDTATWMYDFEPEEIVVGATISFQSRACWSDRPSGRRTAHRVMDIRVTDGVHYYWPQGDANRGPDGCWVPHTAVNGYIIEIHKNTRPENATLRKNVNAASAALDAARDTWVAARDAYRHLRERNGCHPTDGVCYASGAAFDELYGAWELTNSTRDSYRQARDYHDCWIRNARESEYPGHIPYACIFIVPPPR